MQIICYFCTDSAASENTPSHVIMCKTLRKESQSSGEINLPGEIDLGNNEAMKIEDLHNF